MRRLRRRAGVLVAALALSSLVACSSDDDDSSERWQRVPLTSFRLGSQQLELLVDDQGSSRLEGGSVVLDVGAPGIPLVVDTVGDRAVSVVRDIPTAALRFVVWEGDERSETPLPGQDSASLMLRASLVVGDDLYLVVYDNVQLRNRLQRYDAAFTLEREWTLESVEDPAGGTYEMEPPVTLAQLGDDVHVIGGTLHAVLHADALTSARLASCAKALEVAPAAGRLGVLCEDGSDGFSLANITEEGTSSSAVSPAGAPYRLTFDESAGQFRWDDSATTGVADLLEFEISEGHGSGTLELGANNREGRVAWSQIYYLDGLIDAIELSGEGGDSSELRDELVDRVLIELDMMEEVVRREGFRAWCFTVDRSPALFAVQTSRLAMLAARYREVVPGAHPLPSIDAVAGSSASLTDHEEVVVETGMDGWVPAGRGFLAWPRGSKFPFDGLNVPYNHQNEWALGVLETSPLGAARATVDDVLQTFSDHVLEPHGGRFPADGVWPYWWGVAREGWTAADGVSVNKPEYPGDLGDAWITFRSIDAAAMIEWTSAKSDDSAVEIRDSAADLVRVGLLLPQVARRLREEGVDVTIDEPTFFRFARATTPSELPDLVWSHTLHAATQP